MKKLILVLLIILGSRLDRCCRHDLSARRHNAARQGARLHQWPICGSIDELVQRCPSLPRTIANSNTTGATRTVSAGEVIFLRPRDIDRIEIDGRSLDDARYQTRTVDVSLGSNWIDSGVDVKRGERVRVDATGTIYAGRTRITPAGLSTTDPNAPLPRAAEGELIGAIGNDYDSPIIEIGASREFVADRDGRLYLTPT